MYIAMAVGGVALVLIFLYLYGGGTSAASATAPASADTTAPALATLPDNTTPYNYNVAPYDPGPPIQFGFAPPPGGAVNQNSCCDRCGDGQDGFNVNVPQFLTLLGTGTG